MLINGKMSYRVTLFHYHSLLNKVVSFSTIKKVVLVKLVVDIKVRRVWHWETRIFMGPAYEDAETRKTDATGASSEAKRHVQG